MTHSEAPLNTLAAHYVARYARCHGEHCDLWVARDGDSLERAPDFLAGERWGDIESGILAQNLSWRINGLLNLSLDVDWSLHPSRHRVLQAAVDAAQEMAQTFEHPDAVEARDAQFMAQYGLSRDQLGDRLERRQLRDQVYALLDHHNLKDTRHVLYDHPSYWRDDQGQLLLLCQTYTSPADLQLLLADAEAVHLNSEVLGTGPYGEATTAVLYRLNS
ncbi:hypothetical protein [Deinococcus multiflagellatus]|uniref:Uncharacterized protein n=1 Tax=Deinococcus multiflagellatus TaxID=1656887 RepID=A0ABW1ZNV7_9DEIO|nr:hypothetical protein [Deinococcus multiflagellatus]MBZ9714951.1 hypothetical protein [Deinococcus multiflagellatus]